jgi:hypothetical protein
MSGSVEYVGLNEEWKLVELLRSETAEFSLNNFDDGTPPLSRNSSSQNGGVSVVKGNGLIQLKNSQFKLSLFFAFSEFTEKGKSGSTLTGPELLFCLKELELYNCPLDCEETRSSCLIRSYRSGIPHDGIDMCEKCVKLDYVLKKLVELEACYNRANEKPRLLNYLHHLNGH